MEITLQTALPILQKLKDVPIVDGLEYSERSLSETPKRIALYLEVHTCGMNYYTESVSLHISLDENEYPYGYEYVYYKERESEHSERPAIMGEYDTTFPNVLEGLNSVLRTAKDERLKEFIRSWVKIIEEGLNE